MTIEIIVVGVVCLVVGFLAGRWTRKPDAGKRKYKQELPRAVFADDGQTAFALPKVSELDWYNAAVLCLGGRFTLAGASSRGVGRPKWEAIKATWLRNGYIEAHGKKPVTPTDYGRPRLKRILQQTKQNIQREQRGATIDQTIVYNTIKGYHEAPLIPFKRNKRGEIIG